MLFLIWMICSICWCVLGGLVGFKEAEPEISDTIDLANELDLSCAEIAALGVRVDELEQNDGPSRIKGSFHLV